MIASWSFGIFALLSLTAASEPSYGICRAEGEQVEFSGPCIGGQAQGDGTAIFSSNSHIKSITGTFVRGNAIGEVELTYSDGDTYSGGYKDGEPHGKGALMDVFGGGYSGGWLEGFRHGEGVYIATNGRRVRGLWERGDFLGAWYETDRADCRVWWSVTSDPTGTLAWDGTCADGLATGEGTLRWQSDPDDTPATVEFRGPLEMGKLSGVGEWDQQTRYRNVLHKREVRGRWLDGELTDYATDIRKSEYFKRDFINVERRYEGEYRGGKPHGEGRRLDTKEQPNGALDRNTEVGRFERGRFVEGAKLREWSSGEGGVQFTYQFGTFANGMQLSAGTKVEGQPLEDNSTWQIERVSEDGTKTGVIRYADGDIFIGDMGDNAPGGAFGKGWCMLDSVNYAGRCEGRTFETGDYSWKSCLVPLGSDTCLKETGWAIS